MVPFVNTAWPSPDQVIQPVGAEGTPSSMSPSSRLQLSPAKPARVGGSLNSSTTSNTSRL